MGCLASFGDAFEVDIYFEDVDYSCTSTQGDIIKTQEKAVELKRTTNPVTSWLSDFLSYLAADSRYNSSLTSDGLLGNETLFYPALGRFLADKSYEFHGNDISFKNDGRIKTSRVHMFHEKVQATKSKVDAMLELRASCDKSDLQPKPFPYTYAYIFIEQFGKRKPPAQLPTSTHDFTHPPTY